MLRASRSCCSASFEAASRSSLVSRSCMPSTLLMPKPVARMVTLTFLPSSGSLATPHLISKSPELAHELVDVVDLVHHEVVLAVLLLAEGDVEQDLLRVEDVVVVEQRRVEGIVDGLLHALFAFAVARRHDGHATIFEHGLHIVEVEVDDAVDGDNLGNRLGCHRERVVGLAESIVDREVGIDAAQALVVDDEQGIDVLGHLLHAVEGLVNLLVALETEGDGDDAYGEDAHLLGDLGDDGCGTGAGAATHAGGDEGHAGAVARACA